MGISRKGLVVLKPTQDFCTYTWLIIIADTYSVSPLFCLAVFQAVVLPLQFFLQPFLPLQQLRFVCLYREHKNLYFEYDQLKLYMFLKSPFFSLRFQEHVQGILYLLLPFYNEVLHSGRLDKTDYFLA